jgi:purine-binding chemotaxis protein CheW
MNAAATNTLPNPAVRPAGDRLVVTFQAGYQRYALPLAEIVEVVQLPALVMVAGSPPSLCGLLNLRGSYVPVLDTRALVGEQPACDLNSRIVIAGRGEPELGLLVDQVFEVAAVDPQQCSTLDGADGSQLLVGVFEHGEASVLLFDLAALRAIAAWSNQAQA